MLSSDEILKSQSEIMKQYVEEYVEVLDGVYSRQERCEIVAKMIGLTWFEAMLVLLELKEFKAIFLHADPNYNIDEQINEIRRIINAIRVSLGLNSRYAIL